VLCFFFFQAEDGIRDFHVTGVQTCALPIAVVSYRVKSFSLFSFPSSTIQQSLTSYLYILFQVSLSATGVLPNFLQPKYSGRSLDVQSSLQFVLMRPYMLFFRYDQTIQSFHL